MTDYEKATGYSAPPEYSPYCEPRHQQLPLPCVIPQTSKSFKGAFFSPFVRAYVAELANHGISQEMFLGFIDGLNEAFISHPVFQGLDMTGMLMTQAYGVHSVQLAGIGLQLASGVSSAVTSYLRTRAYIKAQNEQRFHPAGLHVTIMSTKDMMAKVKYPHDGLRLPPLNTLADISGNSNSNSSTASSISSLENPTTTTTQPFSISPDDARMRRLRALESYVMPVDFNVPTAATPLSNNILRKMGAAHVERLAKKQNKKAAKQRREADKKYNEGCRDADKKRSEADRDIEKCVVRLEKERAKTEKKLGMEGDEKKRAKLMREFEEERCKMEKEIEKEERKRDKDVGKEMRGAGKEWEKIERKEAKVAMKIKWVVVSRWEGEGVDGVVDDEDEGLEHE